MAYSPQNNPYVPGDPYSYDLKWLVSKIKSNETSIENAIDMIEAAQIGAQAVGSSAEMTNQNRIYVFTGSESGFTAGHWYYWNGSAWTDGGVYGGSVVDSTLSSTSTNPVQNRAINSALNGKQDTLSFPLSIAQGGTGQVRTYSDTSDAGMYCYKFGNLVTITFRGKQITSVSGGSGTIGTISEDYRPSSYIYVPIIYYDGNDQYTGRLIINSDGTTQVNYLASQRWQAPTTGGYVQGFATYVIL